MEIISWPLVRLLLVLSSFGIHVPSSSSQPTSSSVTSSLGNPGDRMALLAFKSSLATIPPGALASWNQTVHLCQWRGVVCGARRHPERVTELQLRSLGLSSPIPTAVANLSFLRRLDLSNNSFYGFIPEQLGRLSQLRYVNMSRNSLTGLIPASLGRCSSLQYISLRNNMLVGAIPTSLGNLSSLQVLSLLTNRLGGHVPSQLGNLSSLQHLYLNNNSFTGAIPSSLAALSSLEELDLSMNRLEGGIPPALGDLRTLTFLGLSNNSLSGAIPPSLSNLTSLQYLYLSYNKLTGSIPPSLGGLSSLIVLEVAVNNLTGAIPASLGNLTSLVGVSFTINSLVGALPHALGDLTSLIFFAAELNRLTGTIPASFYNLSSLVTFALGGNQLHGTLPSDIGFSLPNLQFLSLYNNRFHGPIPSSILNASALSEIDLSDNRFSGVVPSRLGELKGLTTLLLSNNQLEARDDEDWSFLTSLTNCTWLEELSLGYNNLGGVLPHAISNLSIELKWLKLHHNRISGSIPEGIGSLTGLTLFYASDNLLEGTIPPTIGKLQTLGSLYLHVNRLSGQIPASMSNLTQLSELYLGGNKLRGPIPPGLGNLHTLGELDLSHNELSGVIPKELVSISSLSILLNLSHNSLMGFLPTEVGHLRSLNSMDVSENKLFGEIPSTIGSCELLRTLHIQGNAFQGVIPQSFSRLRGLESLDLSRNNLSGKIPTFLGNFEHLNYLNLSFNDFNGEVPKVGIFQNASAVSVVGNNKLCGGISELHLPACTPVESRGRNRKVLLTSIIAVSGAITCLLLLVLYFMFTRHSRRKSPLPIAAPNELSIRTTYSELFKATGGFSPENLIGFGSFGSVYKANMEPVDPNGKLVAVKVINLQQKGGSKSFMAECEALKSIRHRNLLRIMTSCSSIDFNGNEFKALVFEFMPNGSLEQWLHPLDHENHDKLLNLARRLNIAVDVSSALAYLHHHSYKPIVHCDLKPSNVLLDDEMVAHVSDFGLARFLTKDDDKTPSSSLALRGSIGYVAPEYGMGCNASMEGDVFSYGVLLLEMITGRRPTDASFADNLTLHKYVEMVFPDHIVDIVDPSLLIEDDGNDVDRRLTCLVSMARLGLMCSKASPNERMGMEAVTKEMTTIRDAFLRAGDGRMLNSNLGERDASSLGSHECH